MAKVQQNHEEVGNVLSQFIPMFHIRSLVLSDEIARGNSHRIYVDVHGKLCRLLEEAEAVARLGAGAFWD